MCLSNFSTFISLKPLINFSLKNWSAQNQGNADSSFNPTWYRMNIINDCKEIHEFEHTYKHIKACCCSVTQSCLTLCDPMDTRLPLSFTISQSLLKLMSTELVMPSKHLVLCCPLFSWLQSFPALGSFLMSHFFASGVQSIGALASASIPPMNSQDWFPLGLTGWISLQSKGLSRLFSNTTVQKHQLFSTQLSHSYMTTEKT